MAVFLAAADETGTGDTGRFFMGGFIAPVLDWTDYFAPAWEQRVLNRKPPIPHLHMTEIRSREWRDKYGITDTEAAGRVDEAASIIDSSGCLCLVTSDVSAGLFRDLFGETGLIRHSKQPAVDRFQPDHICFLSFALLALHYVNGEGGERVQFLVEKKQGITPKLQEFHSRLPENLRSVGLEKYVHLIGDFIPGGKDRVPLQAADMACWHVQRRAEGTLSRDDARRYDKITSRIGHADRWTPERLKEMHESSKMNKVPSPFKPKVRRGGGSSV